MTDFHGIVERRTATRVVFYTGAIGGGPYTPNISKNGAAFQVANDNTAHEIGLGFYYFDLSASELDTLGVLAIDVGSQHIILQVRDLVSEVVARVQSRMATKDDIAGTSEQLDNVRKLINNGVRAQLLKRFSNE